MLPFHSKLVQYINTACFFKADYLYSLIKPSLLFKRNASEITTAYKELSMVDKSAEQKQIEVKVDVYEGKNKFVLEMMTKLEHELESALFGAYLHGSLASHEEIAYSDFDALVILKDDVLKNAKLLSNVAQKLYKLQQIMHRFDPLQHHGWFVMTECMLQHYPTLYFPPELFQHSKSLLKNKGLCFSIEPQQATDKEFQVPFYQVSNGILNKLNGSFRAKNSFDLKSILSEFMLLPALYLQAKAKKGIYKKESFAIARQDFTKEVWSIMDEVSAIREQWSYRLSSTQKFLLCHENYTVRKMGRKYAPEISPSISEKLTPDFYERMAYFTVQMQHNLKEKYPTD